MSVSLMETYIPPAVPLIDRCIARLWILETGCWELESKAKGSYLSIGGSKEGTKIAHRFFYETFVGKIPIAHSLDHLCRNTRCVNPTHLEPVSFRENSRRVYWHKKMAERIEELEEYILATGNTIP